MIYVWKCPGCGEKVEVSRPVAEYKRGPTAHERKHDGCQSRARFIRVLSPPKRINVPDNEAQYERQNW